MKYNNASQLWTALDGKRQAFLTRMERCAAMTIPTLLLPTGHNHESDDVTHDYQSIGAQATNHIVNKLMLSLFAPSRPFAKLQTGPKTKKQLAASKISQIDLDEILASGEREAVKQLDSLAQRPKLYLLLRHLVITGNGLLVLGKDKMRVMGLRTWCVKRNVNGDVQDLVIKERILFDELEGAITSLPNLQRYTGETEVDHYKWIKRVAGGRYTMTQWINETQLPPQFNGRWTEEALPYRVITWNLSDEANYGTGLVEDYRGDLEALSALSESVVDGAILGTEFRWGVNPTGMTSVDDLKDSVNGDTLPASKDDITIINAGTGDGVKTADAIATKYEQRVARGFLLASAVIRDAERVTTEEVRLTANELETAYGGVYSTLASSLQLPVARWLFSSIDLNLGGSDIKVTILTGLDALSRSGDLDNFRMALGDLAQMAALPPAMVARMKWTPITAFIGQGRGVDLKPFFMNDQEAADAEAQAAANRVEESAATAGGEALATQGQ